MRLMALFFLLAGALSAEAAQTLRLQQVGKVVDAQGICSVQPRLQERGTPVTAGTPVNPGDRLQTDPRGANALLVRLASQAELVLGPGGLVELVDAQTLRLVRGELQVAPGAQSPVTVRLPGGQTQRLTTKSVWRVEDEQATELKAPPNWLQAFLGAVPAESMGALLAKVDGRDVPLTIGYHKVTVDIRDQIARTVIEESFVNHTGGTLEGVFHFPLPQDASISGFGMWIGNELVEADVVEKQRAREIYETILRERRDPGLLEWAGGNIFKARIFPIFAHSEKRIKITYTQVLPMQNGRYRYSYALQSEMLRQHPLRELAVNVRIHSALPLKRVACPTHAARVSQTAQSAQVEFAAQQYTPSRDFEVEIETDARGREAVLVPHQRGDDGYFLLLVSAPEGGGDGQRTLIPDGPPLDVILVADSSASMDRRQREAQDQFLAALLGALGPKDRCRLVAADLDGTWFRDGQSFAPAGTAIAAARAFLAARPSLGWTDLERTFSNVLARATAKTLIVYVGDGIGTTGDADPVRIAQALQRLHKGVGSVHAVATGSSFEPGILKALAGMGGGSFRRIEGRNGPQTAALALLGEITQPALRDLAIEFKGLRAARVYPAVLPNVCAGQQQIVLGRYLPDGRDQSGEVVVRGTRDGKPVRFQAAVALKDAQAGNEFIPRLWARMHLDALLEQGQTPAIKDEIVALSEDYHLMTPYTSFLVLESDEDRERFKVKRRFLMRDGERFFASGRDAATLELRQQQIQATGQWRQDLRRDTLRELLDMGRDPASWQSLVSKFSGSAPWSRGPAGMGYAGGSAISFYRPTFDDNGSAYGGGRKGAGGREQQDASAMTGSDPEAFFGDQKDSDAPAEAGREPMAERETQAGAASAAQNNLKYKRIVGRPAPMEAACRTRFSGGGCDADDSARFTNARGRRDAYGTVDNHPRITQERVGYRSASVSYPDTVFASVFPPWAALPSESTAMASAWPPEIRRVADSLLRQPVLETLAGGVEISVEHLATPSTGYMRGYQCHLKMLYSPHQWIARRTERDQRTLIDWADGETRGVLCQAMQVGRQRQAQPADLRLQLDNTRALNDYSLYSLVQDFESWVPALSTNAQGHVLITLTSPDSSDSARHRFWIDTQRHVLLRQEYWFNGKIYSETRFEDFVQAGGCWWATKITTFNDEGRSTGTTTLTVRDVDAQAFAQQYQAGLPDRERAIVVRDALPDLAAARQADFEKRASFEELLMLINYDRRNEQWDQLYELWQRAEALARGKPGLEWMTDAMLELTRRNEELAQRCLERARRLVADTPPDELYLSGVIKARARRALQAHEQLVLHDTLRAVYARQPAALRAGVTWRQGQAQLLQQAGRLDEARHAWEALAQECPADTGIQTQYLSGMAAAGEWPAAFQWIRALLAKPGLWSRAERDEVREAVTRQVLQRVPEAEWLPFLEAWLADSPAYANAYDHYLGALLRLHQMEKVNATLKQWLEEGVAGQQSEIGGQKSEVGGQKTEAEQVRMVRLGAAVRMVLGQANYSGSYSGRRPYDERWSPLLAQVVTATYRSPTGYGLADQIMRYDAFRQTKEAADLWRLCADVLRNDTGALGDKQLSGLVSWLQSADPALSDEAWQAIGRGVIARWEQAQPAATRHGIGQTVLQLLRRSGGEGAALAFLRRQVKEGPAAYRATYAGQLSDALRAQPWRVEVEDECFRLLGQLSSATNAAERLPIVVPALCDLVDAMAQGRYQAALDAMPKPEALSRTELKAYQRQQQSEARAGLIQRLADEVGRQDATLAPWLTIERLALALRQKQDPRALAGGCRQLLGAAPAAEGGQTPLQWHLADRALTTWGCLAAMSPRDETLTQPLRAFLDNGIAKNPDSAYWKRQKYRLLVALDRPAELEQVLTAWIQPAKVDSTWRVALGYLLAEQDRVPEAIRQFEAAKAANGLGAQELIFLADWYLAQGQPERYGDTRMEALMAESEYTLAARLDPMLRPLYERRETAPPELDPEAVNIFKVLCRKSQYPQNYFHQLRQFYRYTRDIRLLECLAEGMLGHTAQQAYLFLDSLQGLLNDVRDEATVDSLVRHLDAVRARARTRVDQRALDLLKLMAERRAAELTNQPGSHASKALAAMQRVFKGDWDVGERRLMADLLARLGRIKGAELGQEQLRQLAALYACREEPAEDRLQIAWRLAATLWEYERRDEAFNKLEAALAEFREGNQGVLPATANAALDWLISHLREGRHFARAEQVVQAELKRPANAQQAYWLKAQLFEVYTDAIRKGGSVSLGTGQTLYTAVLNLCLAELNSGDSAYRHGCIERLCAFFRAARDAKLDVAGLRDFAFQKFPGLLARETDPDAYQKASERLAETLHDLLGAQTGLEFLIERCENEPEWVRASYYSFWERQAYRLEQWRAQVQDPGVLAERLLRIVMTELRRDLRARKATRRCLYARDRYFWPEQATNFLAAANEVWDAQRPSGAAAKYIAEYLRSGLNETPRAIEMLTEAWQAERLDEEGLAQLAQYQHALARFEDSLPVLTQLVARRPDRIQYRTQLMRAYFQTGKAAALRELLTKTDTRLHAQRLWQEANIAALAASCLENQLYTEAVSYYQELIALHQRTQPNRGIGNGTPSGYYMDLAQAYAARKQTAEAVEAACGAVVSWGEQQSSRSSALVALRNVLAAAPDLDAYVAHLDKQVQETGLENPVVRQALGQVYFGHKQYELAIRQLRLAAATQPNDRQTCDLLVQAYERANDPAGAIRTLLATAELSRRDHKLYQALGDRFKMLKRDAEAERAYTSMVELQPNESESHTLLAEIRQAQGRWPEAMEQWQQVVRVRALEPTGLLKLAEAQIRAQQWEAARQTLAVLRSRNWPERFRDVSNQVENMRHTIERSCEK